MSFTDIYTTDEHAQKEHSMRYLSVTVSNVTGILNRIMSLMRRKRFNIEELTATFDRKNNKTEIILAMDAQTHDINHVIQQIRKLHDVHGVADITETRKSAK